MTQPPPNNPHVDIASTLNNLATAFQRMGQLDESDRHFQESIEMREQLLGWDHPRTLRARNNLALLRSDQDRQEEANEMLAAVVEARREMNDPRSLMTDLNNYAVMLYRSGLSAEAAPMFGEAVAIDREVMPDHPNLAYPISGQARAYQDSGGGSVAPYRCAHRFAARTRG